MGLADTSDTKEENMDTEESEDENKEDLQAIFQDFGYQTRKKARE